HRLPGAHLRRLLPHSPGDAGGTLAANADRADVERRSWSDLRADGQLAVDDRHLAGRRAVQDIRESGRRLRHRRVRDHVGHDHPALSRGHGRWQWPPALAIFIIVVFGAVDATFLASNSLKIVEGGWFPIAVGGAMVSLMLCWRQGSSLVRHRLQEMSMPLERFLDNIDKMVVARPPGVGVWLTKVAHGVSPILLHHVKQNSVLQETM